MGRNSFKGFSRIVDNRMIIKVITRIILSIIFLLGAAWYSGSPILDYMLKDYCIIF